MHLSLLDDKALAAGRPRASAILQGNLSPRISWLILGLITLLYVGTCFTPVIFDDNEGRYAGAVREMHAQGNWLVPLNNGFPRVQKPPLVYWTMLASTAVLGENEFALRLPNALATAGWIMATYLIMRRLGGERLGLASALVLASMLGVWVFTHLIQPEPFLACFISLAMGCLVEARMSGDRPEKIEGWCVLFWIFLALATMSKGLHGALWPLATVGLTALVAPGARRWLRPVLSLRGFLVFLLIVVPWYAYMAARFPGFLSAHFVNEQLGASLNTRFPADAKQLPVGQFYLQHLLFWLPWTLALPAALAQISRSRLAALSEAQREIITLLAGWVGLVMVTVIFSTRQDYYSMSCWGVVAAFLARPWVERRSAFSRWHLFVPCLLVAATGAVSLGFTAWVWPQLSSLGQAAAAPMQKRDTFMDAITGLSPALWGSLIGLLAIFGAAALVAGVVSAVLAWRKNYFPALIVLSGAMAVPVCLAAEGFTIMSPYFSLAENARAINREIALKPDALVACAALPNTASSLLYYLHARVHWVEAPFDNQYAQQVLGLGREYYWDDARLARAWREAVPVYLIVEESELPRWRALLGQARTVHQSGTRIVLCNR
jgi:4-amino-4-deoxy-L-arabinose transferase-like glycosyltransferase